MYIFYMNRCINHHRIGYAMADCSADLFPNGPVGMSFSQTKRKGTFHEKNAYFHF